MQSGQNKYLGSFVQMQSGQNKYFGSFAQMQSGQNKYLGTFAQRQTQKINKFYIFLIIYSIILHFLCKFST
jgi:hypothetical protein